jgi:hypothetical protein
MVEPCGAPHAPSTANFGQSYQVFFASPQSNRRALTPVELETQNVLIEGELAFQVRHCEMNVSQARRWGEQL